MVALTRMWGGGVVASLVVTISCGAGEASGVGAAAPVQEASASDEQASEPAPAGSPVDIDCGDFTTCATGTDGIARCWGRDKKGELGRGSGSGEHLKRSLVPGIGKVKKVALASQFGCALLEDRTVKCWGTGRIANDGRMLTEAKPTAVEGVSEVEELVANGATACARGSRGTVCWGTDDKAIATPPSGAFKQLSVGFTHACAVDEKGAVTCWGAGDWSEKGIFSKPRVTGAVQVVSGDRHACVLTKNGAVQCWGMNDAGQLGTKPDVTPHKTPLAVPGVSGATKLAAGEASTCALLKDGSVRCWGANGEGELGLGSRSSQEPPTQVRSLSDVAEICLASAHGCALTKQGQILCWGSNAFGQLGDGTKERRAEPTHVLW